MITRACFTAIGLVWAGMLSAAQPISYNRDVLPILAEHCFSCHGFDQAARQADLRLDRPEDAARVLDLSQGHSTLLERVQSNDDQLRMPPAAHSQRLSDAEIGILKQWVIEGAPFQSHWAWSKLDHRQFEHVPASSKIDQYVLAAIQTKRPELQGLSPPADRAVLLSRLKLDLCGLPPSHDEVTSFLQDHRPDAYERQVDRWMASPAFGERWSRWWLDLAHYADSDGYLQDFHRPHAWRYRDWVITALNEDKPFDQFSVEQLAGDLLASKWEESAADNMLAGSDRQSSIEDRQRAINWRIATGFLRNTLSNREGGADLEEYRVRQAIDRTNTVATTWLGLTMGCAECHDHKYDPLSQVDYYRFYAFFNNLDEVNIDAVLPDRMDAAKFDAFYAWRDQRLKAVRPQLDELMAAWEAKLLWTEQHPGADHRWDRQLEVLGLIWGQGEGEGQLEGLSIIKTARERRTRDQQARLEEYFLQRGSPIDAASFKALGLDSLSAEMDQQRAALPKRLRAQTVAEAQPARATRLHTRGDFRRPGQLVSAGVPAFLSSGDQAMTNRLQLAQWLFEPEQTLTSRVAVNRFWQELFGRGLVSTSENFGVRGSRPSHPELLDWLAERFIEQDWSIKAILRELVLADTYRQSSLIRPVHHQWDTQNMFLARQSRLRLSAEAVRDLFLESGGLLVHQVGGPAARPAQPDSVALEGFDNKWVADQGANRYRRGLYTFIQRTSPFAQSMTFDLPDTSRSCTRRERSNSPLQALTLLNDPVLFEAAVELAHRLVGRAQESDHQRMRALGLSVLGRELNDRELTRLLAHLNRQRENYRHDQDAARQLVTRHSISLRVSSDAWPVAELAAWATTCSVVLNLDETITRD